MRWVLRRSHGPPTLLRRPDLHLDVARPRCPQSGLLRQLFLQWSVSVAHVADAHREEEDAEVGVDGTGCSAGSSFQHDAGCGGRCIRRCLCAATILCGWVELSIPDDLVLAAHCAYGAGQYVYTGKRPDLLRQTLPSRII